MVSKTDLLSRAPFFVGSILFGVRGEYLLQDKLNYNYTEELLMVFEICQGNGSWKFACIGDRKSLVARFMPAPKWVFFNQK